MHPLGKLAHVVSQRVNTTENFWEDRPKFFGSRLTRLYLHTSTILHLFGVYWCILVYTCTKHKRKGATMPRLSITLTDSQAQALDLIAAETGATRQSMIGLAITSWIRANGHLAACDVTEDTTKCEVCGKTANWTSYADDGTEHYFCDEHGVSDLLG